MIASYNVCVTVMLIRRMHKGLYPLGDIDVIGDRIGGRQPILSPVLSLITLWLWPIYWATGQLVAR